MGTPLALPSTRRGPTSLSEHLTKGVLALIREQRLGPGDRLPSVKELAERFAVATPTMREALRLLEMAGTLDIRHGSGVYVRRVEARLMLTNPYARSLDCATIMDLLETRRLIEPPAAELAARNLAAPQLDELRTLLDEAEQHLSGGDGSDARLGAVNMRFHRGIAEGAGNSILAEIIFSLTELHVKEQMAVLVLYNDRRRDHAQHRGILAALAARDGTAARRLMLEHISEVISVVRGRLGDDSKERDRRQSGALAAD